MQKKHPANRWRHSHSNKSETETTDVIRTNNFKMCVYDIHAVPVAHTQYQMNSIHVSFYPLSTNGIQQQQLSVYTHIHIQHTPNNRKKREKLNNIQCRRWLPNSSSTGTVNYQKSRYTNINTRISRSEYELDGIEWHYTCLYLQFKIHSTIPTRIYNIFWMQYERSVILAFVIFSCSCWRSVVSSRSVQQNCENAGAWMGRVRILEEKLMWIRAKKVLFLCDIWFGEAQNI